LKKGENHEHESKFEKMKNDEWIEFEHRREKDLLKPLPKL
jgi:hypothetical protein